MVGVIGNLMHSSPNIKKEVLLAGALLRFAADFVAGLADWVDENNGEEPSQLKFFTMTHKRRDGTFVDETVSQQFLDEANGKVDEKVCDPSNETPLSELENEVFDDLMYGGEVPKRPIGYGFGVNKGDVYGANALLKKGGCVSCMKRSMEMENMRAIVSRMKKENEGIKKKNEELESKVDRAVNAMPTQMFQVLEAMRSGKPSNELIDAAQSAIRRANFQASDNGSKTDQRSGNEDLSPTPNSPNGQGM